MSCRYNQLGCDGCNVSKLHPQTDRIRAVRSPSGGMTGARDNGPGNRRALSGPPAPGEGGPPGTPRRGGSQGTARSPKHRPSGAQNPPFRRFLAPSRGSSGTKKKGKKCPFFAPCGAKSRGSGGAPPTHLILLRNQRQNASPALVCRRRARPGRPGGRGRGGGRPGDPRCARLAKKGYPAGA